MSDLKFAKFDSGEVLVELFGLTLPHQIAIIDLETNWLDWGRWFHYLSFLQDVNYLQDHWFRFISVLLKIVNLSQIMFISDLQYIISKKVYYYFP